MLRRWWDCRQPAIWKLSGSAGGTPHAIAGEVVLSADIQKVIPFKQHAWSFGHDAPLGLERRFLMLKEGTATDTNEPPAERQQLHLVLNWFEVLKARVEFP